MSSGHIPAEEAAEMHYSERPKCGYCGKFISTDSSKYVWQTDYSFNPPDVLDDYPVCLPCADERGLKNIDIRHENDGPQSRPAPKKNNTNAR